MKVLKVLKLSQIYLAGRLAGDVSKIPCCTSITNGCHWEAWQKLQHTVPKIRAWIRVWTQNDFFLSSQIWLLDIGLGLVSVLATGLSLELHVLSTWPITFLFLKSIPLKIFFSLKICPWPQLDTDLDLTWTRTFVTWTWLGLGPLQLELDLDSLKYGLDYGPAKNSMYDRRVHVLQDKS